MIITSGSSTVADIDGRKPLSEGFVSDSGKDGAFVLEVVPTVEREDDASGVSDIDPEGCLTNGLLALMYPTESSAALLCILRMSK
jgi:hypothetical protein